MLAWLVSLGAVGLAALPEGTHAAHDDLLVDPHAGLVFTRYKKLVPVAKTLSLKI